jgi:predicted Zn-dependent protease
VTARELAERALAAAEGDEAEVVVQSERSGFARFADSEVHQPTLIENAVVQLRIARDGRVGSALTNRVEEDALRDLARRAGEAADLAPPDPHFPGLAPPEDYPDADSYDEETATLGAEEQARLAGRAMEAAAPFAAYGYFTSAVSELAVVSTTGVEAHQAMTDATTLVIAAGEDASGYAEQTAWRAGAVEPEEARPRRKPAGRAEPRLSSPRATRPCSSPTRSASCCSGSPGTASAGWA